MIRDVKGSKIARKKQKKNNGDQFKTIGSGEPTGGPLARARGERLYQRAVKAALARILTEKRLGASVYEQAVVAESLQPVKTEAGDHGCVVPAEDVPGVEERDAALR